MISRPLLAAVPIPARGRLTALSFLVLFVELALIRWAGSNIVYLSFFTNFVLLGSFLGIGIGFLRARARMSLFPYSPVALAFLIGFVLIFPVQIDRTGSDLIFFGDIQTTGLPTWVTLPVVFTAVAVVMTALAEGLAREFVRFEPLEAYRLDILGAIGGIVAFSALSFLGAPPVAWGLVVAAFFVVLLPPDLRLIQAVAIIGFAFMLGRESFTAGYTWSPYYRIGTVRVADDVYSVEVNNIIHQNIWPIATLVEVDPIYSTPYERSTRAPEDVLIIGAGTGNDVALALSRGARHVDAVEIDPALQRLGAELHPDAPYQSDRVEVHITDGRAYLEETERVYDLVLFALPDSLTLVAGQSSVRLESYLFTLEAVQAARDRLAPGGVFSMYNYYREDWLVDRFAGTLAQAFGRAPCVDTFGDVGRQAVLTVGTTDDAVRCEASWQPSTAGVPPSIDDHPFPYLRTASIPNVYLLAMALVLAASTLLVRLVAGPLRPMSGYFDLFLMGAAFLLLETKSVVQFALLFGTTWFVNSLVFAGVLVSVYLAIEVARHGRLPHPALLYAMLLIAVLGSMLAPPAALLNLALPLRFAAAVILWFTPIFIANLVFAQRFREAGASHVAFGANLLGAVVGGVIEYAALISGYAALALLVALLYAVAFFVHGRRAGANNAVSA